VWLFFLCLETPELNMARVLSRAAKGGHSVPLEKIWKRWRGSLNTAVLSTPLVDELWLYDNSVSNREHRLVGAYLRGHPTFKADPLPLWTRRFFGEDDSRK
jgi:predicted ABC-type ATPase